MVVNVQLTAPLQPQGEREPPDRHSSKPRAESGPSEGYFPSGDTSEGDPTPGGHPGPHLHEDPTPTVPDPQPEPRPQPRIPLQPPPRFPPRTWSANSRLMIPLRNLTQAEHPALCVTLSCKRKTDGPAIPLAK